MNNSRRELRLNAFNKTDNSGSKSDWYFWHKLASGLLESRSVHAVIFDGDVA